MAKLKGNRLLMASALAVVFFWIVAPLVPNPHLSTFFSLLIFATGSLTLTRYAKPTFRVVVRGERSQDEMGRGRGSHLAIYGTFLFAFGCICMGAYGLWWNYAGQPEEWIGSPASQFGRACLVAGFCMMVIGPSMTIAGFELPRRWWALLIVAAILIALGFYLGMQVHTFEAAEMSLPWQPPRLNLHRGQLPVAADLNL